MANPEHLAILKQGAAVWNDWRDGHPDIIPNLGGADLRGLDLTCTDLSHSYLSWSWVQPHASSFEGVYVALTDLTGCDLTAADLSSADLSMAVLKGARLWRANFSRAHLSRADLEGTDFADAFMNGTMLGDLDLSRAVGLDRVRHPGPSSIGVDTIIRSRGQVPSVFLRGAGVPDQLIRYSESLHSQPIEFYSCFISYSSRDQDFAERLHDDLQAKGVRCWFAPEDLKIGDRFRSRIDESIRVHDKLLLVLSENSIGSPWVRTEVESAFDKEHQTGRTVLFPIRLDDAVMETEEAWAADIRRTRHIGDFRCWKDHDAYQKAFERLLRDLKAETTSPT